MTDETSEASKATAALSHERLAAIHGRLALISAWPWDNRERNEIWTADDAGGAWFMVARLMRPIDAEFIAHAPEDIDALLTEMERLREQNAQLRAELDDALRDLADCEAEL